MISIDKKTHAAVSAFAALAVLVLAMPDHYAVVNFGATTDPYAVVGAVFLPMSAGVAWEIWRGWQGMESWLDLLANAVGIFGALVVWSLR